MRRLEPKCGPTARVAVTVTGTTGPPTRFSVTLPVAVKRDTTLVGEEVVNTGLTLRAAISAGGTVSAAIRDVTSPGVALRVPTVNDEYVFSGFYEAQ
jgi:hypothetical protein